MSLLGFDTSTAASSACVIRADGEAFELAPPPAALRAPPAHARELMPAIAKVMGEAGIGFDELEAIAVGRGPGTFTGLRIGVATARALAQAQSLELRPVSSLAALAAGIEAPSRLAVIDARRGEVFAALFEHGAARIGPLVATAQELASRLANARPRPLAAGDGSVRFRQVLEAAGVGVLDDESPAHVVRGLHVCRLAAGVPGEAPEAVLPDYLRDPDARPAT